MRYKELKESLSEKQIEQIINVFYPNRQWLRIYRKYSDHLKDSDDAREFAIYLIDNISDEENLCITSSYYYDESRDKYILHIPSKKRPIALRWCEMAFDKGSVFKLGWTAYKYQ